MKKRQTIFGLALVVVMIIIAATAMAWTPAENGGIDVNGPAASIFGDINAKLAVAEQQLTFRNKSGSAIAEGEPVKIDGTSITVVTAATAADDMTIAESLSSEGGYHFVMVSWSQDQGSALTGTLTGTDQAGNAQTETISSAATGRCAKSSKIWKTITDADFANMSGNVGVYAYSYNPITDAASNELFTIGFATELIADNAEGEIATSGVGTVVLAKVVGPSVIPGDILSCTGSQALDEDGTAPVAIALEPAATQTAELIRVLTLRPSNIYGLTSTYSELNILDGVTSTAAELNILDGVTSTAAEINKLDGVTATTAELNLVDNMPASIAFYATAGGANVCEVICDVYDAAGSVIADEFTFTIWLSDDSGGAGLTSTSASGTVQAKSASGADFGTLSAKKALVVQTLATGRYILEITDTSKTQFYVGATVPSTGLTCVSTQLQTADYGS